MTEKVDFKQTLDAYRAKRDALAIVDVPPLQYLMVDGQGDPNTATAFTESLEALYPLAYALKAASKRALGRDYTVMPLEGLWSAADMAAFTDARDKAGGVWPLLLLVPAGIDAAAVRAAVAAGAATRAPARLGAIRLETLEEGRCVQTLHVGSFDDEGPLLAHMHDEFIPANGLRMTGMHHEIYLSDARRVEPAKRRTILRQPVEQA